MLGFCLIVISSIHIAQKTKSSYADEFVSVIALLLSVSCILSFLSIKTENLKREILLEKMADFLFLLSLAGIFGTLLYLVIKVWGH